MSGQRRLLSAGLLCAALLSSCADPSLPRFLAPAEEVPKQFLSRQIIVALSEDVRDQWPAIDREIQLRYGIPKVGEFPLASIRVNCLVYRIPEPQYPEIPPAILPPELVIKDLVADARIHLAQRNQVFEVMGTNDSDAYASMEYGPKAIDAESAHRLSTGKKVSIAVIDTGAEKGHPDLEGRIVKTENFVEGGDASFLKDRHGTAVAGVIAARANNGIGIYGVAPDSEITALKACWYSDLAGTKARCASWTLAKAIDFAINANSRIINLSLSGPPDELLEQLLKRAFEKGIFVVAAASEDKPQIGFPASLPTVMAVISSDVRGQIARPPWLSRITPLAAPGIDILTTTPRDGYDFLSGSSMAAAHVSGVIALLLQQQPQLAQDEVRRILLRTGFPAAASAGQKQVSIINACRALASLDHGLTCLR